jgi:hypothetical protein
MVRLVAYAQREQMHARLGEVELPAMPADAADAAAALAAVVPPQRWRLVDLMTVYRRNERGAWQWATEWHRS